MRGRPGIRCVRANVFVFFSNRMGCLPSLVLSAVVTLILLFATGVLD